MKTEQALADVEIRCGGKAIKLKCLIDTGGQRQSYFQEAF